MNDSSKENAWIAFLYYNLIGFLARVETSWKNFYAFMKTMNALNPVFFLWCKQTIPDAPKIPDTGSCVFYVLRF